MSSIGERIKKRRVQLGLSAEELGEMIGKDRSTVYRYERNEIERMPITVIEPLARALQVSPAYIMGWEGIAPYKTKKIPLLGEIAAGEPIFVAEEPCEYYIEVNENQRVDFCLKVRGDSMINARIMDGDIVFIRQQPIVENGEIAAVIIDGEATLKRVYKIGKSIILRPENPKYKDITLTSKEAKSIQIIGKITHQNSEQKVLWHKNKFTTDEFCFVKEIIVNENSA